MKPTEYNYVTMPNGVCRVLLLLYHAQLVKPTNGKAPYILITK